jgi:hypothetical protein
MRAPVDRAGDSHRIGATPMRQKPIASMTRRMPLNAIPNRPERSQRRKLAMCSPTEIGEKWTLDKGVECEAARPCNSQSVSG